MGAVITRSIVIIVLLFTALISSNAQIDQLRMAQAYEEGGDIRNAARIYLELYEKQQGQVRRTAFDGVVRTFLQMEQYQSLLTIVEKAYEEKPTASLAMLAATLCVRTGDLNKADGWWKGAIELSGNSEALNAEIGRDQRQLLLIDRAITSFLEARSLSGEPLTYARELAELYATKGQTAEAVQEVLNVHEYSGNTAATEGQLAALMTSDSAARIVGSALNGRDLKAGNRLRLWYCQHVGDWKKALELAIAIDNEERLQGNEVLRFATAARREGAYDVALAAYERLFTSSDQTALAAAYGYARTLDLQFAEQPTPDAATARGIVDQYRRIIDKYPDHPLSADAMYRSAVLLDHVLNEGDASRELLTRLINRWRGTDAALEGVLMLSTIYYASGSLTGAEDLLRSTESMDLANADLKDLIKLKRADLQLFKGSYDSATAMYTSLASRPSSIAANDAIDRLGLLILRQEDSVGVAGFVRGLDLREQRKLRDAAVVFQRSAESASDKDVADRCRLAAAQSFIDIGSDAEAEQQIEPLIARIPETYLGDRALVLAADILERSGDRDGAVAALTTLLVQYPRSILAPETRERIRRLRGDA